MKINKRKVAASLEAEGVGAQVQLNLELTDYNPSSFFSAVCSKDIITLDFNHVICDGFL